MLMPMAKAVTVRTSVVINRSIETVWAYLNDHTHETEWRRPSLKSLRQEGTGPAEVGTRYQGIIRLGPLKFPYVNELTAFEPPRKLSWKAVSSSGWVVGSSGSYTLDSEGPRTRFTHEITLEPNHIAGRVVMPLLGVSGSSMVMPLARQLKGALEKGSVRGGG
jgi:uncharacterized protein YndB with AHSA1/START domain